MSALLPIEALHRSQLRLEDGRTLRGHVVDPEDPAARHVVEVLADGLPIGLMRADLFDDDLAREGVGDACYGFCFHLQDPVLAGAGTLEVRLANTRRRVGQPIDLSAEAPDGPAAHGSGRVRWSGGASLDGRLRVGARDETRVKALLDGQVVAETTARDWIHVAEGNGFGYARAFRLRLPDGLADGRVRHIEVVADDGTPLLGSPCVHVGFKDGLARFIEGLAELESERIRAEAFDALVPPSAPFEAAARWLAQFRPPCPPAAARPGRIGVVLIGPGDVEVSLASLAGGTGPRWTAAALPSRSGLGFWPAEALDLLRRDAADCDILVFAPAGTRFEPDALAHLAEALDGAPQVASVYCDRLVEQDGQLWPVLLSAFDYERCLEQGYCAALFAMRRGAVLDGLAAGADGLYRLFNAQFDRAAGHAAPPLHCPYILGRGPAGDMAALAQACRRATEAHLCARGVRARVFVDPSRALPAVRVVRPPVEDRLSIIVPGDLRPDRLIETLRLLVETAGGLDPEFIIGAGRADAAGLRARLDAACLRSVKIVPADHSLNPARATNAAVRAASGGAVLLLGMSLDAASSGWLEEMLGRLREPDVGAVGPVLFWPSGVIRSAGFVLGPEFSAVPRFGDRIAGEPGFEGLLEVAHECSALSAGALLTRRSLYLEVGGLDERSVAFDFADVDFCLKLRERGFRLVVTPHAALRGSDPARACERPDLDARRTREARALRHRWGEALVDDPYYGPNLALDRQPFSGLAWPPRARVPRLPARPRPRPIPSGL